PNEGIRLFRNTGLLRDGRHVPNDGLGKWVACEESGKALPSPSCTMGAPPQPLAPAADDLQAEEAQSIEVPGDPIIPIVASELAHHLVVLPRDRCGSVVPTPRVEPCAGTAQACRGGLPFDDPVALAGPAPGGRNPQQGAGPSWSRLGVPSAVGGGRRPR